MLDTMSGGFSLTCMRGFRLKVLCPPCTARGHSLPVHTTKMTSNLVRSPENVENVVVQIGARECLMAEERVGHEFLTSGVKVSSSCSLICIISV